MGLNDKTTIPGKDFHSLLEVSSQSVPFARLLHSIEGMWTARCMKKSSFANCANISKAY